MFGSEQGMIFQALSQNYRNSKSKIPEVAIPVPGIEEIEVGWDVEEVLEKEKWVECDVVDVSLDAEGTRAHLTRTRVL